MRNNLPKSILVIGILLVLIFLLVGVVWLKEVNKRLEFQSQKKPFLIEKLNPTSSPIPGTHGIMTSEIDGREVRQIQGVVLKKEDLPKRLLLRQPGGEKWIEIESEPRFSKVQKIDGVEKVVKSTWEEIRPGISRVIGACLNSECIKVKDILVLDQQ